MIDLFALQVSVQLAYAALLGLVIGFEREHHRKAAGMRTYALVSFGAALFTVVSAYGFSNTGYVNTDPSRIASQVVVGIGFLGGGLIFLQGDRVLGLTTAAALWVAAAIGVTVGAGMYTIATFSTILTLVLVWGFRFVEEKVPRVDLDAELKRKSKGPRIG